MAVRIREKDDLRDIRGDLRTRISLVKEAQEAAVTRFNEQQEKAIAQHRKDMEDFKATLASYQSMLDLEENLAEHMALRANSVGPKQSGPSGEIQIPMPKSKLPLSDFLLREMQEKGPLTKENLRESAFKAGYFPVGEAGGRAVHATLMNFLRNKRVRVGISGLYSLNPTGEMQML